MNDVDQIGSSIDDYLDNLEGVLEKQLNSIHMVRDKVRKMKNDLKESQRIESLYLKENAKQVGNYGYNPDQHNPSGYDYAYNYNNGDQGDDILLDDDEHLFR